MELRNINKLPEGVGRKIVEALKQQTITINETSDGEYSSSEEVFHPENSFGNDHQIEEDIVTEEVVEEDYTYSEDTKDQTDCFDFYEETNSSVEINQTPEAIYSQPERSNIEPQPQQLLSKVNTFQQPATNFTEDITSNYQPEIRSDFDVPANVEVLQRLISQLPAGVTRQTGAQIIRQTMEAMGISMNKVLSEAQMVQENLGSATKDCLNTVEEYRNNIKILEGKVQTYKKHSDLLGDLINLFIISEKQR